MTRPGVKPGGGGSLKYVKHEVESGTESKLQIAVDNGMWHIHAVAVASAAMSVSFLFNDGAGTPAFFWTVNGSSGYATSRQIWSTSQLSGANISRQFHGDLRLYRTPAPGTIMECLGTFADVDIKGFAESYSNGTEDLETIELTASGGAFAAGSILEAWRLGN